MIAWAQYNVDCKICVWVTFTYAEIMYLDDAITTNTVGNLYQGRHLWVRSLGMYH